MITGFFKLNPTPWCSFLLCTGFTLSIFFTGVEGRLFFTSQLLLWLFLIGQLLLASGQVILPISWLSFFLCLFLLFSCFSIFWSPVPGYTQTLLWRHSSVLLVFFALLQPSSRNWGSYRFFVFCLAIIAASYAVIQYLTGQQPQATYLNKNSLAGFLLPLLFWALVAMENPWQNRISRLLLIIGGLGLGLIASRGAFLALIVGVLCVIVMARGYRIALIHVRAQIFCFVGGLLLSILLTGLNIGKGVGRLATLQDPWSAGNSRFLIWQSSLEMFKDAPWHGIGAGIYGLLYQQYRLPADRSAGHLAHNDLLQIGIELGWPGVILAVLVCYAFAIMVKRALQDSVLAEERKRETIALAAGLMAVFFHSLVTFNLYVYSTLLVIGVLLARIHLLIPESVSKLRTIDLARHGPLFGVAPAMLCLVPLTWLTFGLYSQQTTESALSAQSKGNTELAVKHLATAKRFWPVNDFNWYMEGEVIRIGLKEDGQLNGGQKKELLSLARESFEKAAELNPLRAAAPHKHGLLLEQNLQKGKILQSETLMALYQKALAIDPRYYPARLDLARVYSEQGLEAKVPELLEDGLRYHYYDSVSLIPYLAVARHYREIRGDIDGVKELDDRIEKIRLELQEKKG